MQVARALGRVLLLCAGPWFAAAAPALASAPVSIASLRDLSVEQLADIQVTSASKREEALSHVAASLYVITNEEIARSGAQSLPEALRLAPNLEVMRIDGLDYSISARGFGGMEAANKLLVLIDGRSVYTPLYSGVDWDQQHVLLDDVDRIEVISGPGGSLWGANAVNGVINVRTKSAQDTQGLLLGGVAGTLDSNLRARYGGRIGDAGAFRVYATGYTRGDLERADGSQARDGWKGAQGGFRTDLRAGRNLFTLQGDYHDNAIKESLGVPDGYVRGGDLLGRWTYEFARDGRIEVQGFYDRVQRSARLIYDSLDTWDIQVQHNFSPFRAHAVVWGGGYRRTDDAFRLLTGMPLLDPPSRRMTIVNLFAQDQIALAPQLTLTLGLKLENNSYTKLEYLPNARLAWQVSARQLAWGAVSRAIRNPSRIERDFSIPGVVVPGRLQAEELIAYELGYRGLLFEGVSLSATVFYHDYDDLRTNDLTPPGVLPGYVGNSMRGRTYGLEAWSEIDVTPAWRLSLGGSWLHKDLKLKPGSLDVSQFEAGGVDPAHWIKLRSSMRLSEAVDLDLSLRAYDDVPTLAASGYVGADAYVEGGARLAWRLKPNLELAVTGANLFQARHPEASESRRAEVPRSGALGLRWTY